MGGMSARFLDSKETRQMFQNDEIFQEILKGEKVDPKCIEIIYAGASSAAFTEIGTAMTAEFKGDAFEKTTVLCSTRVLTPGGSYFHIYVINSSAVITQYYIWFSKYEVFTVTCLAAAAITTSTYFLYSDDRKGKLNRFLEISRLVLLHLRLFSIFVDVLQYFVQFYFQIHVLSKMYEFLY